MPRSTVRAPIVLAMLSALVAGCAGARPVVKTQLQFVFGHEDRSEHRAPAAVEVVLRDGWGTTLHGVQSDGIYYSRGGALYRKPLSDAPAELVYSVEQPPRLVTSVGNEVIWVTADCEVTSSVHHQLGGECVASPTDVFVDGETIYLFAFEASKWRQPEMTLWTMPRRHAVAKKVATLPDYLQLFGASRPVFDGQDFYYMGLYGQIFRVSKHGGAPKQVTISSSSRPATTTSKALRSSTAHSTAATRCSAAATRNPSRSPQAPTRSTSWKPALPPPP